MMEAVYIPYEIESTSTWYFSPSSTVSIGAGESQVSDTVGTVVPFQDFLVQTTRESIARYDGPQERCILY